MGSQKVVIVRECIKLNQVASVDLRQLALHLLGTSLVEPNNCHSRTHLQRLEISNQLPKA